MLHNGIYASAGKYFKLPPFSIYVLDFFPFWVDESVYLFLLKRLSSFIFRDRFLKEL